MGKTRKTNEQFLLEAMEKSMEAAKSLACINPECTNEYGTHSLLKLVAISYWVGIFTPIAEKNRIYGKRVVLIDALAGCGITKSKDGELFCGSTPSALLAAQLKNHPFNVIVAVEKDLEKKEILEKRLNSIRKTEELIIIKDNIENVSKEIVDNFQRDLCYSIIDPEGTTGLYWSVLESFFSLKGDIIISWFYSGWYRVKKAALAEKDFSQKESDYKRMEDLFSGYNWKEVESAEELTNLFVKKIMDKFGRKYYGSVRIPMEDGRSFFLLLFPGNFKDAERLVEEWETNLKRRYHDITPDILRTYIKRYKGEQKGLSDFN